MLGGILGVTLHYFRYGPKEIHTEKPENGGQS